MGRQVGNPQIGQWYLRWDSGELFQVTGLDEESGTVELQSFDGDLNEIELDSWRHLPLARAEPTQFAFPIDEGGAEYDGYSWDASEDGHGIVPHSQEQILEQWDRGA